MRKPTFLALAAGLIIGGAAAFQITAGEHQEPGLLPYSDADAVAAGAALYAENCAACHGAELQGEADWQVRGADGMMPAPPHDETGHTWHHPDALLFAITKYGSAEVVGRGYQSNMIGFGDMLSDAEILAVLAYIKSTWPAEVIEIHNGINAQFEAQQQ